MTLSSRGKILGLLAIAALLIALPVILYLQSQQQDQRSKAAASSSLSFAPQTTSDAPRITTVGNTVSFDIMLTPGNNAITFAKMDISYDPRYLTFVPTSHSGIQFNQDALPQILEGPTLTTGKIRFAASVGSDPTKAIIQPTKIATVTFTTTRETSSRRATEIEFSDVQLLSAAAGDQANENVYTGSEKAYLIINGISPTPTITPTPVVKFKVSGIFFVDNNRNGVVDSGEAQDRPLRPKIELRDASGKLMDRIQNERNTGAYAFKSFPAGNYTLSLQGSFGTNPYTITTPQPFPYSFTLNSDKTINIGIVSGVITPTPTGQICAQVITRARNTSSGECKDFSNACIPAGWVKDSQCIVGSKTPTPTRTPTPKPGSTTPTPTPPSTPLSFTVFLHGIGKSGDSANETNSQLSNKNPLTHQRDLTLQIFDANNQPVPQNGSWSMFYDNATGSFKGVATLYSILQQGAYTLKVGTNKYLTRSVPGIITLKPGQTNVIPPITLIAGDAKKDNALDIFDYNMLYGCYSVAAPARSCTAAQKTQADLNDDGAVNQYDYNLFLRELGNRNGD